MLWTVNDMTRVTDYFSAVNNTVYKILRMTRFHVYLLLMLMYYDTNIRRNSHLFFVKLYP
jgi:hypothetical protein